MFVMQLSTHSRPVPRGDKDSRQLKRTRSCLKSIISDKIHTWGYHGNTEDRHEQNRVNNTRVHVDITAENAVFSASPAGRHLGFGIRNVMIQPWTKAGISS